MPVSPAAPPGPGFLAREWRDPQRKVFLWFAGLSLVLTLLAPAFFWALAGLSPGSHADWFPYPTENLGGADLRATYQASANLAQGLDIYANDPAVGPYQDPRAGKDPLNRYSYPPPQAYLLYWLTWFDFPQAYLVWQMATLALIVLSLILVAKIFPAPRMAFICLSLAYWQSSFLFFELERGQTEAPVLFCLAAMVWLMGRPGHSPFPGVFCALGTALKVTPAVFLVSFALRRDFKNLASFALTLAAVVLATGPARWIYWATKVVPYYADFMVGQGVDHSLAYFLTLFLSNWYSFKLAPLLMAGVIGLLALGLVAHRDRDKYLLVEAAILSIVMNMGANWSANYKLMLLPLVFLTPFSALSFPWARKRPGLFIWPLGLGLFLAVPQAGVYVLNLVLRLVPALAAQPDLPRRFYQWLLVDTQPRTWLQALLVSRKVPLGLIIILVWLLAQYLVSAWGSRREA